jgi:hypothetical protein
MEQLVQAFLLKELYGWEHESKLVEYLDQRSSIRKHLGFESVPDQSTFWRTWHRRFAPELREMIETVAGSILIQAERADVSVPRQPPERSSRREESSGGAPSQQEILGRAEEITEQVSEIIHPAYALDRGEGVRSTRTHSGSFRLTSVCTRVSRRTRVHAVFSTSPIGSGHHLDTITGHTYELSLSVKFVRCTGRQ